MAHVLARKTVAAMSGNAMGDLTCRPLKAVAPSLSNDADFIGGNAVRLSFLINPQPPPTDRLGGSFA